MGTRRITSSLGEQSFDNNFQTLTIDDESVKEIHSENDGIDWNDAEQRIAQAKLRKNQIKEQQNRATPQAVSRLELLLGIGRATTEVKIENVIFSLRSLKSKEFKEVINYVASIDLKTRAEEIIYNRNATLAMSIYKINSTDINDLAKSLEAKINLIEEFDEAVIGKLSTAYNKMTSMQLSDDPLGKTPEEIIDNIKKS